MNHHFLAGVLFRRLPRDTQSTRPPPASPLRLLHMVDPLASLAGVPPRRGAPMKAPAAGGAGDGRPKDAFAGLEFDAFGTGGGGKGAGGG